MLNNLTGEEFETFEKEFMKIIDEDFKSFDTLKKIEQMENGKTIFDLIELSTKGFIQRAFYKIKFGK